LNRFVNEARKKTERNFDAPKLDYIQINSGIKWYKTLNSYDGLEAWLEWY